MKNTTIKKIRSVTIISVALLSAYLLFSQQAAINKTKDFKPLTEVQTLKSTSLSTVTLIKREQHQGQQTAMHLLPASSLQDTEPDGAVNLDSNGNVKADKDLHRLFDYYLSSRGELDLDQIRSRLLMASSDFLSLNQLEQLRDYFDQYVEYLEQSKNFAISFNDKEPLSQRLSLVKQMRETLLGKELAEAFFADEHAYAEWVLNQDNIETEKLTEQQFQWLAQEEEATRYQDVLIQNNQFNQVAASQNDRFLVRRAIYGDEVAERLSVLDQQQQAWQNKVEGFLQLRAQVNNQTELVQLQQQYSPAELKRLNVYWREHNSDI